MLDTFATRISGAVVKEKSDAETLIQDYGCLVKPFGQGQLPDEIRDFLHRHTEQLPIRWLPDLMVIRPALYHANVTEWMWLVDSKYQEQYKWGKYDNWVLEKAAHASHRLQRVALGLPIVYIWPDGRTCSYVDDLTDEVLLPCPWNGNGSGTPCWKVPKKLTRTLDEVFGKGVVTVRKPDESHIQQERFQRFLSGVKIHIAEDQWDNFIGWAESWYASLENAEDAFRLMDFLGGIRHKHGFNYQDYTRLIKPYMDTSLFKDAWPFLEHCLQSHIRTFDLLVPSWKALDRKQAS